MLVRANGKGVVTIKTLNTCPETVSLPPSMSVLPLPAMECWPFAENHQCYCFLPLVNVMDENGVSHGIAVRTKELDYITTITTRSPS